MNSFFLSFFVFVCVRPSITALIHNHIYEEQTTIIIVLLSMLSV